MGAGPRDVIWARSAYEDLDEVLARREDATSLLEDVLDAANRELKEEVGFGARKLTRLRSISLAPTYMNHEIHLVLAEDLYPERLPGDEPEELEVVPWRLDALHELMLLEDCSEGRSLAALFIVREILRNRT